MREFDLLQHIYKQNAALGQRITIPPGDDMGAVRIGNQEVLVTVDQVADGLHVDLRKHSIARVARKTITRNLSDVAAMAAKPVAAVVAGSLPHDFGEQRALELFDAMRAVAMSYDCPIIGGDISMWDHPLLLTVTILAEPDGIAPVLRSGSQPGDVICVSGELGGSLEEVNGRIHHLDFEPRLSLARKLAGTSGARPHAMIDLSDGLARDLGHLCEASGLDAIFDAAALPISAAAKQRAVRTGRPAWEHAIADGEDYELCFTVSAEQARQLPHEIDGVRLSQIGTMAANSARRSEPAVSVRLNDGSLRDTQGLGWEHHGP